MQNWSSKTTKNKLLAPITHFLNNGQSDRFSQEWVTFRYAAGGCIFHNATGYCMFQCYGLL